MGLIIKNNVIYNGTESEPIIYSEEEREVGVWTDGKPLYQKTFYYASLPSNSSDWQLLQQSYPLEELVTYNAMCAYSGNRQLGNGTYITISYYNGNLYYHTPNLSSGTLTDVYVTIQYTKTTDTPGSGTWTPSGVKTVHYSENEQVIGTWTDRSTLYEQTFNHDISGDQEHWYVYLDTLIDGINDWTIINWEGFIQFQEDGIKYAGVLPGNVGTVYLHRDSNRWRLYFHQGNAYCTWGIISITIRYIKKILGQPVS